MRWRLGVAVIVLLLGWPRVSRAQATEGVSALGEVFRFPRPTQVPVASESQPHPDPLFGVQRADGGEGRVVRPFYTRRRSVDGTYARTQVLWPLWLYERDDEQRRIQLFPFYYYYRDVHRYGDVVDDERDWALFPIVWGGDSTRDGGYFAVFPLGGRWKGLLAKEEIRFVLFPLWIQWRDRGHVSTTWLWPIFMRGHGGGKDTFRVWPFYGRTTKANVYDRRFYAWPFVYRERFDLGREQPGRRTMTWPFWTTEDSARRRYRSVLWPFFSHEENYAGEYRETAAPWPFWVRRTGKSDRMQMWPLFSGFREGDRETHHVAGPLIRYSRHRPEEGVERSQLSVALFIREERTRWAESGRQHLYSRVWPFFNYETWPSGESETNVLSLIPFRDSRGFEYQYAPVYTLYHHERRPGGRRLSWALWNLYRHERTPDRNEWRVWPLVRYAARDDGARMTLSFLEGLVTISRVDDDVVIGMDWFGGAPSTSTAAVPSALPALAEGDSRIPGQIGT